MHAGPMGIDRHDRRTFRGTAGADRLSDHQAPAIETRMFPGRYDVAFDARELHTI